MNTQETFDWKQAAKYWAEGKAIQWSYIGDYSWKEFADKNVAFYKDGIVYRLRPSPPPEPVKWARGAFWDVDGWHISPHACSSLDKFKECHERDSDIFIWPARFDQEGFLIIPPEMNQNKE